MIIRELTLLNTPSLVAILLRTAANGPTTIHMVLAALKLALEQADEHPPVSDTELQRRLKALRVYLVAAQIIDNRDQFQLTARGIDMLAEHPMGFDIDELTSDPAFSAWLQQRLPSKTPEDVRAVAFDSGYGACLNGQEITDNPYPADSADHQVWEGGWCEALDARSD